MLGSSIAPIEKGVIQTQKKLKTVVEKASTTSDVSRIHNKRMETMPRVLTEEMKVDLVKIQSFIEAKFEEANIPLMCSLIHDRLAGEQVRELTILMFKKAADDRKAMDVKMKENHQLKYVVNHTVHVHTLSLMGILEDKIKEKSGTEGTSDVDLRGFLNRLKNFLFIHRTEMEERVNVELEKIMRVHIK